MRSETLLALALLCAGCGSFNMVIDQPDAGDILPGQTLPEIPLFTGAQALSVTTPLRCSPAVNLATQNFDWRRGLGQPGTGLPRVFASLFRAPPRAAAQILNPQDAVWWWSTGWKASSGQGSDGEVKFSQGRGVKPDGTPDATVDPDSSGLQGWLWFAVWAWDSDYNVAWASEARAFCAGGGCDRSQVLGDGATVASEYCRPLP